MKAKYLDFHVRVNLHNWLDDSVFRGLGSLKHFAIWKIRGRQWIANGSSSDCQLLPLGAKIQTYLARASICPNYFDCNLGAS